jgi:fukutin
MNFFKNIFSKKEKISIDKNDALKNLVEARTMLDKLNIRYWLTDGTLLGFYRNSDFIDHDEDLDMGASIESFNERMILDFTDSGWRIADIYGKRDCGLEISFKKRKIKLDIFFFYTQNGKMWHGAWRKCKEGGITKRNLIKYSYEAFGLKTAVFKGENFNIPEDPEKYIMTKYGKNWKTPVKQWDWEFGPSNAEKTEIVM